MRWYSKIQQLLRRWKEQVKKEEGFITTEVLLFIGIVVVISVAAWTFRDAITGLFGRGTTEVNKFIQ
ncbi:MAG: hypothetical protein ACOY4Q_07275 [Bacillota bacterium]